MKNRFVVQLFGLFCVASAGFLFAGQEQHVSLIEVRMKHERTRASHDPQYGITRKEFVAVTSQKLDEDKALLAVDMKQLLSGDEKAKIPNDGISINGNTRFFNDLQDKNSSVNASSADSDQACKVWPMREMYWLRDGLSYSCRLGGDIDESRPKLADKIKSFLCSDDRS